MILVCYGTRPEFIKIKPLVNEMKKRGVKHKTLFTGQHMDIVPKDADFILNMSNDGTNRLDSIIESCLNLPNTIFEGIDYVLVQGDTSSVLGLAMAAFHRKIKVIHLEAGLRTYDKQNPFPEETNRRIVSSIADIHLCPTELSADNLKSEKIEGDIHVVGNTVLDNLLKFKKDCEYTDKVLITMHRRENQENMDVWFTEINKIAINNPDIEFIIPLHPNPNVQKHKGLLTNVNIIEPLSHDNLMGLLVKCRLVITDSGGLQEECSFFNKKCLVCRKITERPESIGLTSVMISEPSELSNMFTLHFNDYELDLISPYGDGKASQKICDIFENL